MSAVAQRVRSVSAFAFSRRGIPVFKGALAYTLVIMLPMLNGFDDLNVVPLTYSAAVIVAIAGFPGKSTGECLFGVTIALLGVGMGAANFAILGKLRVSLVAQAIVFVIMVYILSIVKAADPRLFAFSLLAILMTFYGVYVSILTGGFSPIYLESYFKAYLWGGVVVVGVNLFVFPISSEKELRQTLVLSLDHIGTLAHLLAKSYTNSLTDEDRAVREQLSQTIRQDFGLLNQKVGASAIEINYTRWSLQDYHALISQTRTMQLSLIALHSSLAAYEKTPVPLFEERFLPSTIHKFHQLRRDTHRTIVEIQLELGCKPTNVFGASADASKVYYDLEKQAPAGPSDVRPPLGASANQKNSDGSVEGGLSDKPGADLSDMGAQPQNEGILSTGGAAGNKTGRLDFNRGLSREDMMEINARLLEEAETAAPLGPDSDSNGATTAAGTAPISGNETPARNPLHDPTRPTTDAAGAVTSGEQTTGLATGGKNDKATLDISTMRGCAKRMKQHFLEWEASQRELLTDAIVSGHLTGGDMTLYIKEPRPSIWDTVGPDHIRGRIEKEGPRSVDMLSEMRKRRPGFSVSGGASRDETADGDMDKENLAGITYDETAARDISSNHSLMRVFSVIFALDQFTTVLAQCHTLVKRKDSKGEPRKKRLRFHLFESLGRKKHIHSDTPPPAGTATNTTATPDPTANAENEREWGMREAMARLEGREYTPVKPNIWQRLHRLEALTRTADSVYAMKVAGAALVYGALIWADGSRAFFIKYSLTSSLLTIVVALTPTLGQSLRSFVLQIAGSGIGYIVGMIILEIFKNVGGYHFNPYGLVALTGLYSIPMSYLLYNKPQIFTFSLLAMNACGVLVLSEYINVVHSKNIAYGEPPLRVARSLTGLAIALAIVIAFQLIVLRNPARRTLRKALAKLVYSNLSYNNILQSLVRGTMSADPTFHAPPGAIKQTVAELAHRETKIQAQILAILPLVAFAQDEPQLAKKFEAAAIARIIRANQIILDRQAEARTAIGTVPFSPEILNHFISVLSPYRKRILSMVKARFVLSAASLASKTPLPHDSLHAAPENWVGTVTHDALVLSQTFAATPEGKKSIQSGEFTRYWFYMLTISSLSEQLGIIEDSCRTLFGEIEDDPRLS